MSDTDSDLKNVVIFPANENKDLKKKIAFIHDEAKPKVVCFHSGYYVNEHDRTVKCRDCGKVIDAFELLLSMAKNETRLVRDIEYLRKEEKQRRENIDKLIQIERNAKSRIRRANKNKGD
ncbi:hypothetical protein [Arsenophonus nasoniae]|uniref:Bacteriophage protein n=1 Tax=Arsenophonus nasoniae TaxID=638 RepID=A0AA95GGM6_9GAMM|nr:hypothetical protein [Arsenophonus nasoniae]WGL95995.1 hypothetical protein QE207_05255 [Arsenophonus nasoniae]